MVWGVECIKGEGRVLSPWEVEVTYGKNKKKILTTKNIILSTGASPFVPPIPNLQKADYLTSDNLWKITKLPGKLVVMGGGPIGCELAQAFARLGSKVTQIEMRDRIMAVEDEDVSRLIQREFEKDGVNILTGHGVIGFENKNKLLAEYKDQQGKKKVKKIPFDKIIVAVGRKANVKNYGLEELGIKAKEKWHDTR